MIPMTVAARGGGMSTATLASHSSEVRLRVVCLSRLGSFREMIEKALAQRHPFQVLHGKDRAGTIP
jgi:hypothetical protein